MIPGMAPLLCSSWNFNTKTITYRIQPANTSKFVLLSTRELRLLQQQINRALEGTDDDKSG